MENMNGESHGRRSWEKINGNLKDCKLFRHGLINYFNQTSAAVGKVGGKGCWGRSLGSSLKRCLGKQIREAFGEGLGKID